MNYRYLPTAPKKTEVFFMITFVAIDVINAQGERREYGIIKEEQVKRKRFSSVVKGLFFCYWTG